MTFLMLDRLSTKNYLNLKQRSARESSDTAQYQQKNKNY